MKHHGRKTLMVVIEILTLYSLHVNSKATEITTTELVVENATKVVHINTSQKPELDVPNSNGSANLTQTPERGPLWIIHQGSVSQRQSERVALILNAVLKPIICVFGLIGNILGIGVLFRKELRRSTYWYLCGLTVSDTLYLLCSLIMALPAMLRDTKPKLSEYLLAHDFPYIDAYLSMVFSNTSAWLIVILSIERFLAVSKPLKIRHSFIDRFALQICVVTYLIAFVYNAPNLGMFETKTFYDTQKNDTIYKYAHREWSEKSSFRRIYGIVSTVLVMYIPLLIVISMNIGIVIEMQVMRPRRIQYIKTRGFPRGFKEQTKLNITLVVIAFFYVISVAPRAAILTIGQFDNDYSTLGREHFLISVVRDVTTSFVALSSANDFVVYYLVSDVIRESFKTKYGCLWRKANKSFVSTNQCRKSDSVLGTDLPVTATAVSTVSYDTAITTY